MKQTDNLQKRYAVYCRIFAAGLLAIVVTFLPYLADYYILQPQTTVLDYYAKNSVNIYYSFETMIVVLTVAAIWCISARLGIAIFIPSVLFLLLSYASSIKYAALGDLFHLSDLRLAEAAGIAVRNLNLKFTPAQLMVMAALLFLCVGGFASDRLCRKYPLFEKHSHKCEKTLYILRIFLGFVCLTAMFFYGKHFIKNAYSMESIDNATVTGVTNDRYILYNFLKNDNLENIDITHVEDSYKFFLDNMDSNDEDAEERQFPNVIVIMNESWWNTDNIPEGAVTFSSDPMETYHRLAESCSSGNLSTNILGGGTLGSETEFLTGLNIKYLTSFAGIATEITEHGRKIPNIVDYFDVLGYDKVAIHPYDGSFYDRDILYSSMGFDKIIFEEDMYYNDAYNGYISDESLAKQIIKEYEEMENMQKFIFAVSIGNHIRGLESKYDFDENYPYSISVTLNGELDKSAYTDLLNYVNGINLANEAFAQLVSYFENREEPTLLLMFGDHMPYFSQEAMTLLQLDGTDPETIQRKYSVPVLLWSNFESKKIVFEGENINYLPQMVLEYSHLPETDMSRIIKQQRNVLRANSKIAIDCRGQLIETYNETQVESIRHFKVVNYDIIYGSSSFRERVWQPYD
ncbi:MAG: LTA synthase family protein [Lachnospiraceae bacterium]|nr:LTA synthase family protein [Lachnospiraceae bacterium]